MQQGSAWMGTMNATIASSAGSGYNHNQNGYLQNQQNQQSQQSSWGQSYFSQPGGHGSTQDSSFSTQPGYGQRYGQQPAANAQSAGQLQQQIPSTTHQGDASSWQANYGQSGYGQPGHGNSVYGGGGAAAGYGGSYGGGYGSGHGSGYYANGGGYGSGYHRDTCRSKTDPGRFKTTLCKSFSAAGTCRYEQTCQFAHGEHELRTASAAPVMPTMMPTGHRNASHDPTSKYKTVICKSFASSGTCRYEGTCQFAHGEHELRQPSAAGPGAHAAGVWASAAYHSPRADYIGGAKSGGKLVMDTSKFKTQLCANFMAQGMCRYEGTCQFAHGTIELRSAADSVVTGAAAAPSGSVAPPYTAAAASPSSSGVAAADAVAALGGTAAGSTAEGPAESLEEAAATVTDAKAAEEGADFFPRIDRAADLVPHDVAQVETLATNTRTGVAEPTPGVQLKRPAPQGGTLSEQPQQRQRIFT